MEVYTYDLFYKVMDRKVPLSVADGWHEMATDAAARSFRSMDFYIRTAFHGATYDSFEVVIKKGHIKRP